MGRLKSISVRAIATFLYRSGLFKLINRLIDQVQAKQSLRFPWIHKRQSRPVHILMYHGIDDAWSPFLPTAPVKQFMNHMQYLSDSCHVLALEEAIERMQRCDVPHRAVVITLDDGYRDNYLHAFPILKKFRMPATIFLATSGIGTGTLLWHDRACWMISTTSERVLSGFGSHDKYDLRTPEGKRLAQDGVLLYLRSLEDHDRISALDRLSHALKVSADPTHDRRVMLNWEEVKEMSREGIQFGAHTVNHPILTKIVFPSVIDEIRESKNTIERHVGEPVTAFAYPSGRTQDYNDKIKEQVKEEGFLCAVSTVRGSNYVGDDLFDLKRVSFWDHDIGTFGLRFEYSRLCG